jgi:hypothetical protein
MAPRARAAILLLLACLACLSRPGSAVVDYGVIMAAVADVTVPSSCPTVPSTQDISCFSGMGYTFPPGTQICMCTSCGNMYAAASSDECTADACTTAGMAPSSCTAPIDPTTVTSAPIDTFVSQMGLPPTVNVDYGTDAICMVIGLDCSQPSMFCPITFPGAMLLLQGGSNSTGAAAGPATAPPAPTTDSSAEASTYWCTAGLASLSAMGVGSGPGQIPVAYENFCNQNDCNTPPQAPPAPHQPNSPQHPPNPGNPPNPPNPGAPHQPNAPLPPPPVPQLPPPSPSPPPPDAPLAPDAPMPPLVLVLPKMPLVQQMSSPPAPAPRSALAAHSDVKSGETQNSMGGGILNPANWRKDWREQHHKDDDAAGPAAAAQSSA